MLKSTQEILSDQLATRKENGLLRSLFEVDSLVDFCSNDYLGLAKNEKLTEIIAADFYVLSKKLKAKNGATGSRLISGHSELHARFEAICAEFHQSESALLFGSGYEANLGLISAVAQEGQVIFCDQLLHASLIDGLRLCKAERRIFKHNNIQELTDLIQEYPAETIKWVVVESVYSMDGDQAPLVELVALRDQFHFELIVDEAHSGGIYGSMGQGKVHELGIAEHVFARVITFGKAWGNTGAVVLGSSILKNFLINFARPFIYSTAPSPSHVSGLLTTLKSIKEAHQARKKLKENIEFFRSKVKSAHWGNSQTTIQTFFVPGNKNVRKLSSKVQKEGFAVKPIVYPSVPEGTERIRITLNALQSQDEIMALINLLESHE